MHWYENLIAYLTYNSELKLFQKKAKHEAERRRHRGLNSDKSITKEMDYIAAIKHYEKLGRSYKPPKIGTYLSKYSHVRYKLENRRRRLVRKFSDFLEIVNSILKPKNYEGKRIELRVNKISFDYRVDSEGNVTFDRKFLDKAKRTSRTDGLLPGLILLFPALTESAAMSMEKDSDGHRTGRYVVHGSKRYSSLLEMLDSLIHYQLTDNKPKKLIRRHKITRSEGVTSAA